MPKRDRLYLAIYIFILAPIGAVVAICAMLLFGVTPHSVFAPGFAIRAVVPHAPKAVGVVGTAAVWWVAIVIAGLVWDVLRRRPSAPRPRG
jgi:hypothetical protein